MLMFVIDGRLPSLNDYINVCRYNKYDGNNFKKDVDKIVEVAIRKAIKDGKLRAAKTPVTIDFNWVEGNRRRDLDNIYSAKKYILDAMQKCGIIPNDSQKYVTGLRDSIGYDKNNPRVIVTINEVESDCDDKRSGTGGSKMSNREHLYRGKRKDNGEWIEGHLLRYEDGRARIIPRHTDIFCYENDKNIIQTTAREVIPETVGEWTGLCDKNSKRIFEGDIVKTQPYTDKLYAKNRRSKQHIGVVQYKVKHFKNSGYEQDYEAQWDVDIKNFGEYVYCDWSAFFKCEVISNVHDNPELLEV